MMLQLTQNKQTIIDEIDNDLSNYKWCIRVHKYAGRRENHTGKFIYLHRIILERKLGRILNSREQVDHINGDTLDNRRSNLRPCSHSQNQMNSERGNQRGIYQHKNGRWRARIKFNYRYIHLGYFDTREQAINAFRQAADVFHGEYSYLRSRELEASPDDDAAQK